MNRLFMGGLRARTWILRRRSSLALALAAVFVGGCWGGAGGGMTSAAAEGPPLPLAGGEGGKGRGGLGPSGAVEEGAGATSIICRRSG